MAKKKKKKKKESCGIGTKTAIWINGLMEQNREPRNSLQTYGQLIGKGYESIKWEEDSPLKNGVDKAGQPQVNE